LVSVAIQTYQHKAFIKQCLDSVLTQQTNFNFEILLGEDASTDGTREICIEYAKNYPTKIRLFLHHRENNIKVNGMPTGRFNFVFNLFSAKGKYIAICEGDDYWSSPSKLQRQVDFLEANTDCILCHHWQEVAELNENQEYVVKPAPIEGHGYFPEVKSTVGRIFSNELRVKARTLMFRNVNLEFPDWYFKVAFGDVPLSMLLGKFGKFGFINEPMAVYRLTGKGMSTQGSSRKMHFYVHFLSWIKIWEYGNMHYNYLYKKEASATIVSFYKLILNRYGKSRAIVLRLTYHLLYKSNLSIGRRVAIFGKVVSDFF